MEDLEGQQLEEALEMERAKLLEMWEIYGEYKVNKGDWHQGRYPFNPALSSHQLAAKLEKVGGAMLAEHYKDWMDVMDHIAMRIRQAWMHKWNDTQDQLVYDDIIKKVLQNAKTSMEAQGMLIVSDPMAQPTWNPRIKLNADGPSKPKNFNPDNPLSHFIYLGTNNGDTMPLVRPPPSQNNHNTR